MSAPEGEAFFLPDGGDYVSTELTRGPWDPGSQHGGPPAALLGRAVEQSAGRDDLQVARVTFEILKPVPIGRLHVTTEVVRAGRGTQIATATLSAGPTELMRARALSIRTAGLELPDGLAHGPPPAAPDQGKDLGFFPTGQAVGYHTAMEFRFLAGGFLERGPASVWTRMRFPLVPDEDPSPLCRVLIAADSGNGVSGTLDFRSYVFVNPDLTVALHRAPVGEWIHLDARTEIGDRGAGLAHTAINDLTGAVGHGLQTLFVSAR